MVFPIFSNEYIEIFIKAFSKFMIFLELYVILKQTQQKLVLTDFLTVTPTQYMLHHVSSTHITSLFV